MSSDGDKAKPRSGTPPDGVWEAMARELASNPDSPASLRIQSAIGAALRPRQAAVDQVVQAFVQQLEAPGPGADAAIRAALGHWGSECGAAPSEDLLEGFRQEARSAVERRRRQPPAVESIVADAAGRLDAGYALGVDLGGLRGTWHRLWASISMGRQFGDSPEQRACVAEVRAQFEALLGRALTPSEWAQLEQHAIRHADTVLSSRGEGEAEAPDRA